MKDRYSSKRIIEEIKYRIKEQYKNQEFFGKELGISRKSIIRLLNHRGDIELLFKICKTLDIKEITID